MSNSSKLNDLAIARLLEDDDEISDVDDEIADPDFCLQDSDTDDIMSIEDEEGSECDVSEEDVAKEIDNANEHGDGEDAIESIGVTKYFYGKNGYKWSAKEPARCSKTPLHNIVRLPKALQQNLEDGIIGFWSTAKKLCYICPSRLKRKTPHVCLFCTKPMCMGCSKRVCVKCANKEFDE